MMINLLDDCLRKKKTCKNDPVIFELVELQCIAVSHFLITSISDRNYTYLEQNLCTISGNK